MWYSLQNRATVCIVHGTLVALLAVSVSGLVTTHNDKFKLVDVMNKKYSVVHDAPARIAVASQCGGDFFHCENSDFTKAFENHKKYAEMHNYEYFLLEERLSHRSPVWDRLPLVSALHHRGAEWVLYLDADALFMNASITVEAFLEKHNSGKDLLVSGDGNVHYQAGVYLMRNSAWNRNTMCKAWKVCPSPGWEELGAMMTVLGGGNPKEPQTWAYSFDKLRGCGITESEQKAVYKDLPEETREHLGLLPQRAMDSYHSASLDHPYQSVEGDTEYQSGDWIIHFAGMPSKNHLVRDWARHARKKNNKFMSSYCSEPIQVPKPFFDCSDVGDDYVHYEGK